MNPLTEKQKKLLQQIVSFVDEEVLSESFETFHFGSKVEQANQDFPPGLDIDVGLITVLVEQGFLSYQSYGDIHRYTLKQEARDFFNATSQDEKLGNTDYELNSIRFDLVEFKVLMNKHFNLSDLEELCFDLGIDKENIEGTTLRDRIRNLIELTRREGNLPELIVKVILRRENADWKIAFKQS